MGTFVRVHLSLISPWFSGEFENLIKGKFRWFEKVNFILLCPEIWHHMYIYSIASREVFPTDLHSAGSSVGNISRLAKVYVLFGLCSMLGLTRDFSVQSWEILETHLATMVIIKSDCASFTPSYLARKLFEWPS